MRNFLFGLVIGVFVGYWFSNKIQKPTTDCIKQIENSISSKKPIPTDKNKLTKPQKILVEERTNPNEINYLQKKQPINNPDNLSNEKAKIAPRQNLNFLFTEDKIADLEEKRT